MLAGSPGTAVKVALIWGKDPGDRQTVTLAPLTSNYRKFPFKFQAQGDSDDARMEITATGAGSFHIGAVSLMPADNIEGFRKEIVAALKQLRFGGVARVTPAALTLRTSGSYPTPQAAADQFLEQHLYTLPLSPP